jgi:hypothetical protein
MAGMKTSEIARKARLILESREFAKGASYGRLGGSVCTLGATCMAVLGTDEHWDSEYPPADTSARAWQEYREFVKEVLAPTVDWGYSITDGLSNVFAWNDDFNRTKQDVLDLFARIEKEYKGK